MNFQVRKPLSVFTGFCTKNYDYLRRLLALEYPYTGAMPQALCNINGSSQNDQWNS